ncbi:UPF0235 protein C15orf40 [Galemys pyrenaicus]|uniref:UPF0235 protein C15orf40 n=1 Tax=Galemys pyrenaicus TaxID=202257 RepID=A0A8J6DXG1_GALPY|nr:UPF0235 protein C15orf40 [Galemys pyrenaicus]
MAVDPKGYISIAICAKPGSKQNAVTDLTVEPAVGSVAMWASLWKGVAKASSVLSLGGLRAQEERCGLHHGGKFHDKVVKLLASSAPEEFLEKLKKQAEKE